MNAGIGVIHTGPKSGDEKFTLFCSDGDGGLNDGQGGDGVEIDELNGDHEQTGHDVNNNQC